MHRAACLLIALLSIGIANAVFADTPAPNIIYILADDLGYGDVSCLNEKSAWKTAHIDRLAREGMSFTDAHSGSSVCTPTRYGILTGRYSWRSRLKSGVLGGRSPHLIPSSRLTVAKLLQDRGYHTACIGKWHLGWDFAKDANDPKEIDYSKPVTNGPSSLGFDEYYCHNGSLDMAPYVYVHNDHVTAAPDRETVNRDYQGFWRKGATGADFFHEDVLPNFTRRAVEYVTSRAKTGQPFFLYLPLAAPHTPILPTEEFRGASKTNPYGDFMLQVDDTVGRVTKAVDDAGIADNTLIIFTSDNGCSPRAKYDELAQFGHDPSHHFRGHKADIFEGGHRVPFVVRWPARVKAGTRSDDTICHTDLMRTCADIVGAPIPDNAAEDSVSILPALAGTLSPGPLREATVHHSVNGSFALRQGKWKLIFCPGSGGWSEPRPKRAAESGLPGVQLFDLSTDIGEERNLWAEHPEVVRRMTRLMEKYVRDGRSTPGAPQKNEGKTPIYRNVPKKPKVTASQVVYKTVGDVELRLHVFAPAKAAKPTAAAVFFFGGGWRGGTATQFQPHCEFLAARGMVGISAEYRVERPHKATPFDCVADARSALRYVRAHADDLGIDPKRIVAGGGSAGGHLAAALGTVPIPEAERDAENETSSRPDALILFNPVFDNGPGGYGHDRVGERYRDISPLHNLDRDAIPPTVVFLGTEDKLVPVATAEKYKARMEARGHRCDLHLYEKRGHGFFNHRGGKNEDYDRTVAVMDAFLVDLGFLRK